MTKEELRSIKEKIRANIEAHKENISVLEHSIQQLPPDADLDRETRMELINYKRNCEAQIRSALQKIKNLESASKRVDGPDYGICIECDKPIETTKLMLIPETLYCVKCHRL